MANLVIKNLKQFEAKVKKIQNDGKECLHVVADFDQTLSKEYVKGGKHAPSTWDCFHFSHEYHEEKLRTYEQYYAIEIDVNLPYEYRKEKLIEWGQKSMELMIHHGLTLSMIREAAKSGAVEGREGVAEFFAAARKFKLPTLVLSGGLGDVISEYLQSVNSLSPNVHIISNFFTFNDAGLVTGFKGEIVHPMNKSELGIEGKPYGKEITGRKNVIIIGDKLHDIDMAKGVVHETCLSIGYVNTGQEKNLGNFRETFDVVLVEDGSLRYPTDLIEKLCEK